ncbi:hypothetical protein AA313_de0208318 [Arthrobotrys entomopaga]|nr:hypothetical protein AA313_de0208318 [Arthrobotrys entomopaga]
MDEHSLEVQGDEPVAKEKAEEDPRHLFHESFTAETKALTDTITSLPTSRASERQSWIDNILSKMGTLTHDLKDAATYLPAYDQRVYSEQLKSLTEQLSNARKELAPRQKFSFKNRGSRTTTSTEPPPPTTTAVTASPPVQQTQLQPQSSQQSSPTKPTSLEITSTIISSHENTHLQIPKPTQKTTILSLSNLNSCIVTPSPSPPSSTTNSNDNDNDNNDNNNNNKDKDDNKYYTTLSVTSITSSLLIIHPQISGPAHLTSLRNTTILLSCHQFRLHSSHNVDIYLKCGSRPIIEDCSGIRISYLPCTLNDSNDSNSSNNNNNRGGSSGGGGSNYTTNTTGGGDGEDKGMYNKVDDFNWLKVDKPSPNWRCLEDSERIGDEVWNHILSNNRLDTVEVLDKVLPKKQ